MFNFRRFLRRIDPSAEYQTSKLSGGLVNLIDRATRVSPRSASRFPDHDSLILKHAPPFVAALGESAPFSQDRQAAEAGALAQFTRPIGPFVHILDRVSMTVPRVLHHDVEHHVLVLEDLGALITLNDYLALFSCEPSHLSPSNEKACEKIGARIGAFFGELHSPPSLQRVVQSASHGLTDAATRGLVYELAILPVKSHLEKYAVQDSRLLFARVQQDFERPLIEGEPCFVLGDFHPGAVLLEAAGHGDQKMGIIDWEFSCKGRGPNGDMAQCLGALHVSLLSSPVDSEAFSATKALIRGICGAYHQRLARWVLGVEAKEGSLPTNSHLFLHLLRSALIVHGCEIINNAMDREWPPSFSRGDAVGLGAWYLSVAGDDVHGMTREANWRRLLTEERRIILDLFNVS